MFANQFESTWISRLVIESESSKRSGVGVCRSYIHVVMDEVSTNGRCILQRESCYPDQMIGDNSSLPMRDGRRDDKTAVRRAKCRQNETSTRRVSRGRPVFRVSRVAHALLNKFIY